MLSAKFITNLLAWRMIEFFFLNESKYPNKTIVKKLKIAVWGNANLKIGLETKIKIFVTTATY